MAAFRDHFSGQAGDYARFRPGYPARLFAWLADAAPSRGRAWDCGTGSGQAACGLAEHFREVVATEPSAAQLAHAAPHPRVRDVRAVAESAPLRAASVDVVAVAQALHWFDLDRFYGEVRRVARPGALLAVWTYGLARVSPPVDAAVRHFYGAVVGPYWPPERRHVESGYRTLPFPFDELPPPPLHAEHTWTLRDLLGFLRSWSAVGRYRAARGVDPVAAATPALAAAWGHPSLPRRVRWPLALRVARVRPTRPP
jgi:SAM-dependent methyltransferase